MDAINPSAVRSGLRRPESLSAAFAAVLVFAVVYFARPQDLIPGLAKLRIAVITGSLAAGAFVLGVMGSRRNFFRLPREMWYLVLLFVQLCAAVVFSPVWRGGAFEVVVDGFSKVVLITIVVALTTTTLTRLRKLILVQALSIAVISTISILKSAPAVGRLSGALGGIYGNANDLAFAMAMATPLCWAFALRARTVFKKTIWVFLLIAMAYGVVRTASRGGLIVLVATVCVCLWEFGVRGKRRFLLIVAVTAAVAILALAPTKVLNLRFGSISNSSEDQSAYDSFQQRRGLFWRSLDVTLEHPLLGIGPGNFQVVSGNWHVSHNSYTELSAEGGIPALVLFLLMLRRSFWNLRTAARCSGSQDEGALWGSALRATLAAFMVGAWFASVSYQLFPYMLVAYTTSLHQIMSGGRSSLPRALPRRRAKASRQKLDEFEERLRIATYPH